jgi:predicted transcriptional regulator
VKVVSVKVDTKVKEKMKKLAHVNWSQVIREAIAGKIEEEERKAREIDSELLIEAARMTDTIRKAVKGWSSVEEIRRWREARR